MSEKIGVYICECGPNIKDSMDLDDVMEFVRGLEDVVLVESFKTLCSDEGRDFIVKEIKENDLSRVVIAACSPKEHEITFKRVLNDAGLNPFLLQMANIREQCAWVIRDKSLAADKAKMIIKAAVNRVALHEPLETKQIECQADVLVVGAGMAGISAALTLVQNNRKVYLVEKSPCIGGRVARYEEVFPSLDCASCMLHPKLDEVLHNEDIEVLTLSEVQEVKGSYGNFIVKVKMNARHVDAKKCIGCGTCMETCPVTVRNEFNEGLDKRKAIYVPYAGALPYVAVIDKLNCIHFQGQGCPACQSACPFTCIDLNEEDRLMELHVGAIILSTGFDIFDPAQAEEYGYGRFEDIYTSLEFERLLSSTGPTGGKVLLKNGRPPERIAIIHCVGSRDQRFNEHCSGICCSYSLKFTHLIKQKSPDVLVAHLYSDFCLPGKASQGFFNSLGKEKGIDFVRIKGPDSVRIDRKDGRINIEYTDIQGKAEVLVTDMVVLAPAIEGSKEAENLARIFSILQGKEGFFVEEHTKLAPTSTASEGIFIAGCAQGPKDIQSSVAEGQAAAGRILSGLIPGGRLMLEAMVSVVDEDLCSGCKTCIGLCPYKALAFDDNEKHAVINEVLCKGCGVCVAGCPSAAIKGRHFTDQQIYAEIKGLLR